MPDFNNRHLMINIFVHKILIPVLNKMVFNPWEGENIDTLQTKCKSNKVKCVAGDYFFVYILWQFLSNKKDINVIDEKSKLNEGDNNAMTRSSMYKPTATLHNFHFETFNFQFSTIYDDDNNMKKGSHVAIFDFNKFQAPLKFWKLPNFLLGALANSIFNHLDLNGKGLATRKSVKDPWEITGEIGGGIRGFINVIAMKKVLSKLFPPST